MRRMGDTRAALLVREAHTVHAQIRHTATIAVAPGQG
jgi:hypothetical protein